MYIRNTMARVPCFLVLLATLSLVWGPAAVPAQAGALADAPGSASVKAKKCKKLKGKKKRKCLKNANQGKNGRKPWVGSPYKPKMTCAMSPEMQKKYARYGLTCIDLGFGVTTLIEL